MPIETAERALTTTETDEGALAPTGIDTEEGALATTDTDTEEGALASTDIDTEEGAFASSETDTAEGGLATAVGRATGLLTCVVREGRGYVRNLRRKSRIRYSLPPPEFSESGIFLASATGKPLGFLWTYRDS